MFPLAIEKEKPMHFMPRGDKSYNWGRCSLKENHKKTEREPERSLSGTALDCTVTIGLDPPGVGTDCKSIEKNSVLGGSAAQGRKVEWKMENVNYIKVTVTFCRLLLIVQDYCLLLA